MSVNGVTNNSSVSAAAETAKKPAVDPNNPHLQFLVKATGKSADEILSIAEKIAAEQKISIDDALIALENYVKDQLKKDGAKEKTAQPEKNDSYAAKETSPEEAPKNAQKMTLQEKQSEAHRLIAGLSEENVKPLLQLINGSPYIFTVEHLNALFGSASPFKYDVMSALAQRCPNIFRAPHAEALVTEFRRNPAAGAPLAVLAIKTPHIFTIAQLETLKAHFEGNFLTRYINAPMTGASLEKVKREQETLAADKGKHASGTQPELTKTITYLIKSTESNPAQVKILRHLAASDAQLARSIIKILSEKSATNKGIADALAEWALTDQQHAAFIAEGMIAATVNGKEASDAIAKIASQLDSVISDEKIDWLIKESVENGNFFCATVLAKIIVGIPQVREERLNTFYEVVRSASINTTTVPRILQYVAAQKPDLFTAEIIEHLTKITTEQTNYATARSLAYILGSHKFDEKHFKAAILALSNAATEKVSGPSARVLEFLAKTHPEYKGMIIATLTEAALKGNEPAADAVKKLEAPRQK